MTKNGLMNTEFQTHMYKKEENKVNYGIALRKTELVAGLTRNDVVDLFDMLDSNQAYPIELMAREKEHSAQGFITPEAAKELEYEYEESGLRDFIADILDGNVEVEGDNSTFWFKGIKIWLSE